MTEYLWVIIIPLSILFIGFLAMFIRSLSIMAAMISYFVFAYIQMGIFGIDQTQSVINAINWSLPVWLYTYFVVRVDPMWPLILIKTIKGGRAVI